MNFDLKGAAKGAAGALTKKAIIGGIVGFVSSFPTIVIIVIVCFLPILFFASSTEANDDVVCMSTTTVNSVCKNMIVNGESMSVDDYVAGVIEHEFGGADLETLKAQAVAARSYGIASSTKDSNGNCDMGSASEATQTYSSSPSAKSKQAASETSGEVLVDSEGNIARSEYSSNSLPAPYSSYSNTVTMAERDLEIPMSWFSAHKTCDDSALNNKNSNGVYGCGHGRGMGQIAALYLVNEKKYTYKQVLEFFYGKDSEYKWTIGTSSGSSSSGCSSSFNGNFKELSEYNIGHKGLKILDRELTLDERNNLDSFIIKSVNEAGYGTGAGVAAAGQSLVWGLQQMGYYLGYCWGGDRSSLGVGKSWGKRSLGCDSPTNSHKYYGMDCSGFVDWSIRNACKSNHGGDTTYSMRYGPSIPISQAKPGDLMLNSSKHVRLVIKNNGDGSVLVAEEGGNYGDLVFDRYNAEPGYDFIDMSKWYMTNCARVNPSTPSVLTDGFSGSLR